MVDWYQKIHFIMKRGDFFSLFFVVRQALSFVLSTRPWYAIDIPVPASLFRYGQVLRSSGASSSCVEKAETTDVKVYEITRRLKLEIFDLEEGIFGFDSLDSVYGEFRDPVEVLYKVYDI